MLSEVFYVVGRQENRQGYSWSLSSPLDDMPLWTYFISLTSIIGDRCLVCCWDCGEKLPVSSVFAIRISVSYCGPDWSNLGSRLLHPEPLGS